MTHFAIRHHHHVHAHVCRYPSLMMLCEGENRWKIVCNWPVQLRQSCAELHSCNWCWIELELVRENSFEMVWAFAGSACRLSQSHNNTPLCKLYLRFRFESLSGVCGTQESLRITWCCDTLADPQPTCKRFVPSDRLTPLKLCWPNRDRADKHQIKSEENRKSSLKMLISLDAP